MTEPRPLSHSSAKTLLTCEQKYYWYKVAAVERDSDYEKSDALSIGSAVHYILEQSGGGTPKDILADIEHCFTDKDILLPEERRHLVHALVLKMVRLNKHIGFKPVLVEPEILKTWFRGFIDLVELDEETGKWWIVDYKCLGSFYPARDTAKLYRDPQLNLYSGMAPLVAKEAKLDMENFGGARWRVVVKSAAKMQPTESEVGYVKRLLNVVKAYDIELPVETLNPEAALELHKKLHKRSLALYKPDAKPIRNYSSCMDYFKPCEYWSRCHGKLFSEMDCKVTQI